MTRLTFGQALATFYRYITCTGPTDPIVAQALNFVLEKFQKSPTHYKGSQSVIPLVSRDHILTLPQGYEAIDGLKTLSSEEFVILQSQQFAFQESTSDFKSDKVAIRQGGGFATQYDPPNPQVCIFTTIDNPLPSTPLHVRALDQNGQPIYTNGVEGFTIDLSTSPTANTPQISRIYQIIKPPTQNPIVISAEDGSIVGILSPLDQNPDFHRYQIGGDDKYFAALATRAFKIISDPNDLVIPANLNALRYGMQAWQYEENDDLVRAQTYWAMAYRALDEELETFKSDATEQQLNIQLKAFAPRIRNLI